MVTNQQLYLAIGAPMLFNVVLVVIVVAHFNSRIDDLRSELNARIDDLRSELNGRIDDLRAEFNLRIDDLKDLWRSELHRVEEVLDARLKHLEHR